MTALAARPAERWAPWIVGLLAFALSTWDAGRPGLWFDEVVTLTSAERSWASLIHLLGRVDAVHAAYYAVMHVWLDVVPYSPWTLRIPSALAVAATSGLLVWLGGRLWSLPAGVVAGLAFPLIPRASWMAVEARSYAFAALAATLLVCSVVVAVRMNRWTRWVAVGAAVVLAAHFFLYSLLLAPVLILLVALQERRLLPRLLVALGGAGMVCVPLLLTAIGQRGQIGWIKLVTPGRALTSPYYAYLWRIAPVGNASPRSR